MPNLPTMRALPVTVGRIVHLRNPPHHWRNNAVESLHPLAPMAAIVAYAHSDRLVNVMAVDHCGQNHAIASVTFKQPDDPTPPGMYVEWME